MMVKQQQQQRHETTSSSAAAAARSGTCFPNANWPDALPHPESLILSVSCGNTHYTWALHERYGSDHAADEKDQEDHDSSMATATTVTPPLSDFVPTLLWKTSTMDAEMYSQDPCQVLRYFLPPAVLELVFGAPVLEGEDTTRTHPDPDSRSSNTIILSKKQALTCALSRRIPAIQVYVVSTNPENEHGLAFLLQDLPVQVFRLQATDFFSTEQGAYPTLGVDRAATAKAAMSLTGVPALVLDGGTALTYTGVDIHGNLEGGGITPGLQLQFRALSEGTGALPHVSPQQVLNTVQRCKKQKKPLEFMARNTKEAIMCAVLRETAAHVSAIVASWQDKAQAAIDANHKNHTDAQALDENALNNTHKTNTELAFLVSGGDGTILTDLLAPQHSHIVAPLKFFPHSQGGYASQAKSVKHLIHHGIRQLLTEKQCLQLQQQQPLVSQQGDDDDDEDKNMDTRMVRESLLGLRVVRNVVVSTRAGDSPALQQQLVRGTVEGVKRGATLDQDRYRILYDDKAREELTVAELYVALLDYKQHSDESFAKQDASARGAATLLRKFPNLKDNLTQVRQTRSPSAVPPPPIRGPISSTAAASSFESNQATTNSNPTAAASSNKADNRPVSKKPRTEQASGAAASFPPNSTTTSGSSSVLLDFALRQQHLRTYPVDSLQYLPMSSPSSKSASSFSARDISNHPRSILGHRVVKQFEDRHWYYGTISEYYPREDTLEDQDLWNVHYDDGDVEDFNLAEVVKCLKNYNAKRKAEDPQKRNRSS